MASQKTNYFMAVEKSSILWPWKKILNGRGIKQFGLNKKIKIFGLKNHNIWP